MLKTLKQQQGIILAAVAALAVVVAAGYFSAVKRSEPKYRNKVEEMMFEEGNKSPKYVITLPDKKSPQELKEERQRREASAPGKQSADDDMTPQQRVLSNMPLLIKLKPVEDAEPLGKLVGIGPCASDVAGDAEGGVEQDEPLDEIALSRGRERGDGTAHAHAEEKHVVQVDVGEFGELVVDVFHVLSFGEDRHLVRIIA